MHRLTRRELLLGTSAMALNARIGHSTPDAGGTAMLELTAAQAVRGMSTGDFPAEGYAQTLLAQCLKHHDLNAFISLHPDQVLAAARAADLRRSSGAPLGALHGLPIPIKDSVNTRDYPTTVGTPALRNFRPKQDAPIVASLINAGAIVLGKTNLHELSYGWTSNNLAFGAVRNPYDRTRIPGGSSGGTAAAIAARIAPLGLAEDTEGSIRVPAALSGITGFRPSTGRYPTAGAAPITGLFDQVGPHARCVSDIILFDQVATGDHRAINAVPLKGIKIAVARAHWFAGLDSEVERIAEAAILRLRAAGAEIVEAEMPEAGQLAALINNPVQNHDVRVELTRYLQVYEAPVSFEELVSLASADIREIFSTDVMPGSRGFITEEHYRRCVEVYRPRLQQAYKEYFARTGAAAMMFPATMITAPPIGSDRQTLIGKRSEPFEIAIARNIGPGGTAALPGLVLPAGLASNGMPVAMEFDAPNSTDRRLLALGLSIEKALGPIPPPAF